MDGLAQQVGNDTFMGGVEAGVVCFKDDVNYSKTSFFHPTEGGTKMHDLLVSKDERVKTYAPLAGINISFNPHKNVGITGSAGYIFGDSKKISPLGATLEDMNGAYGTVSLMVRF
jgi:hypothetical protein